MNIWQMYGLDRNFWTDVQTAGRTNRCTDRQTNIATAIWTVFPGRGSHIFTHQFHYKLIIVAQIWKQLAALNSADKQLPLITPTPGTTHGLRQMMYCVPPRQIMW
ncbi:hypothetical protein DPMN_182053 [Dreissena polymorpha]|uniref:Uncharacterized protein n=1 Tax=Dreissena polymorpha TaxID=45954 RepID=A0A9D4I490_DREPO|nr:hypothetical protein DPMN_182053 [Dreissena polymorpha]